MSQDEKQFVLRLSGDLTIKSSSVRARFQGRLKRTIHQTLLQHGIASTLQDEWSSFYLFCKGVEKRTGLDGKPSEEQLGAAPLVKSKSTDGSVEERTLRVLATIFGLQSFSRIDHSCPSDLPTILEHALALYKSSVSGKSFAVKTRRRGTHDFDSPTLSQSLGALLNQDRAARVDLKNPDITIHVDVRGELTFFYTEIVKGAGGLPLGTQGKCLSLLSGGFDSAVASWMLMKRGAELDYIFCNLASQAYERSVLRVVHKLNSTWGHGSSPRLYILDFAPVLAAIKQNIQPAFAQIVLKRCFYRVSEGLALILRAEALVTGEALGQVSSQTLVNLRTIESCIDVPVFRPLIGFDKNDIVALSRYIGTYGESQHLHEYCQIAPHHKPSTACSIERIEAEEGAFDWSALLLTVLESRKIVGLKDLDPNLLFDSIFVSSIPESAEIFDCQTEEQFEKWHHPDAVFCDLADVQTRLKTLPKSKTYLFYCMHGTQSAVFAELLQNQGFEAYSFEGGAMKLKALASVPSSL